jgi:hypothetical protein
MQYSICESGTKSFRTALNALNEAHVPYVIGGAFAIYRYSGAWRNTNDLDLYLERRHISQAADILAREGFLDYGEMAAGDREWIYHAMKDGTLIDLIWQPPNHMASIDESFYENGTDGEFLDVQTRYMSASDLIWTKIFIINRQRCDWPDIFHVIRSSPSEIDWSSLVQKIGDHWPVLLSFVVLFDWVYPNEAQSIPQSLREDLLNRKNRDSFTIDIGTQEYLLDPWVYTRPLFP